MPKPESDAPRRLQAAAVELFTRHGYDAVSVSQIAEAVGLNRSSFFRHFSSKREVLFADVHELGAALTTAVQFADRTAAPIAVALDAIRRGGLLVTQGMERADERQKVIDASPELQEHERTRLDGVTSALAEALQKHGVAPTKALLTAQLATLAFQNAFLRWVHGKGRLSFGRALDAVVTEMRATIDGQ